MAEHRDLLLEIGTEELPARILPQLAEALARDVVTELDKVQLSHSDSRWFATPRRLAVLIHDVAVTQPEQRHERRGPALQAAFDDAGQPTRAAEGFARSCGVSVAQLETIETDKGAWLINVQRQPGKPTAELLPGIVTATLDSLPMPKRMRWGSGDAEFLRPVRWIVLLFGSEAIPAHIFGLTAGKTTFGHRFHCPAPITLERAAEYPDRLRQPGWVIADFGERRQMIRRQTETLAAEVSGRAVIGSELLDEVTALVEWPVALLGAFEERFLDVPPEALMTTMQDNQKYFPIVSNDGILLPYFITIANLASHDPDQVRSGNERVIRPRFSDAEFFWQQDRQRPLVSRREALKHVIFQQQLGTLYDKSLRVERLVAASALPAEAEPELVRRAARLAKCDLLTDMVQEFPELQGIMGRYYACHDGEPGELAQALEEQYLPRFAGDRLPETMTGKVLALAERLDTLVGIFAIGQAPTGTRDPFALRRSALGVIRLLIEGRLDVDLLELLQEAAQGYAGIAIDAANAVTRVLDFIMERLRGYYLEQGYRPDAFEAVLANRPTRLADFDRRLKAVIAFGELPEAASLAAANKRIRNILRKAEDDISVELRPDLLHAPAEQRLAQAMMGLAATATDLMAAGDYELALQQLAALREPVDQFFDEVMVMTDDTEVRANRLVLLDRLSRLFSGAADLSRLRS